ncbi:MAG: redoxin domain-containing protein, partial [Bacteroidota bacterium]
MNNKKVQYALFIVALAALLFGIWKYRQPRFGAGDIAPDFEVTTVEGTKVRLSDLRGKYVLLQFWGSWCGPCRQENPFLTDLY